MNKNNQDTVNTEKKQSNRFKPGQSGNPSGRPRGSRNRSTLAVYELLDGEVEELTRSLIEEAKAGNMAAVKLCLERIAPPLKHTAIQPLDLPPLQKSSDLPVYYAALNDLLADGVLSLEELGALVSMADKFRQSADLAELEARLMALESAK